MPSGADPWRLAVAGVRDHVGRSFDELTRWCSIEPALADFRPRPGAWTAREVLEHVHLADRFLLLLAEKIAAKSARRLARGAAQDPVPPSFAPLHRLRDRDLAWRHPPHMTPSGELALDALARELAADRERCLGLLDAMPRGEGSRHCIRMSVVGERLDLYGYLEVIALHADRHLDQLARNRRAWK